jgi:hypothetical protein
MDVSFTVGLQNYRDVDANVTFGVALIAEASFSWGIKYIIEVGVFLRGTILGA